MMALYSGSAVLLPSYDSTLTMASIATAMTYTMRMAWDAAAHFLHNLADTIFSLQPARAAGCAPHVHWRGAAGRGPPPLPSGAGARRRVKLCVKFAEAAAPGRPPPAPAGHRRGAK